VGWKGEKGKAEGKKRNKRRYEMKGKSRRDRRREDERNDLITKAVSVNPCTAVAGVATVSPSKTQDSGKPAGKSYRSRNMPSWEG